MGACIIRASIREAAREGPAPRDGDEPWRGWPGDEPLGRVGAPCWPVETAFQQYKGEAGLDEYGVRSWRS